MRPSLVAVLIAGSASCVAGAALASVLAWPTDPHANLPVCTAGGDQSSPQIIADGQGGVIICWTDGRIPYPRMGAYAQRINAAGVPLWSPNGVSLSLSQHELDFPILASDGASGAFVVWEQSPGVDEFPDLYAQHIGANGALLWGTAGQLLISAREGQYPSAIVPDGNGGAIVVWSDGRDAEFVAYGQRLSASGQLLWPATGVRLSPASVNTTFIRMIADDAGGAFLVWDDDRNYYDNVFAQHIDSHGNALWTPDGVKWTTLFTMQLFPTLASDGAGGIITTWTDERSDNGDVYAQRVDASGTPRWGVNGTPVVVAPNVQGESYLVADGVGGAIVTWDDRRAGGTNDVYAQRLDAAGAPQWPLNGVLVCDEPSYYPSAVPDGEGGAILWWNDGRSPAGTYAQRVDSNGQQRWERNGVRVSYYDGYPVAGVSDGARGAVLTWADDRNGTLDLFAQRLSPPHADAGGPYAGVAGVPVHFSGTGSTDAGGEPLAFTWSFGDGGTDTGVAPAHAYVSPGSYTASLAVSDGFISDTTQTAVVVGPSNHPPDCSQALAIPDHLWPPDHKLVPVRITGVRDPDGDPLTIRVTGVTQDEPARGQGSPGDDKNCPDAVIAADGGLSLRSERSGGGNGRVYAISFTATDSHGAASDGRLTVCVPPNQGAGPKHKDGVSDGCVDDGQQYNSLVPCSPVSVSQEVEATTGQPSLTMEPGHGPSRTLAFTLAEASDVRIDLYDVAGRRVAGLTSGPQDAGTHRLGWNAGDLRRGIYFCRLEAGGLVLSKAVLVLD